MKKDRTVIQYDDYSCGPVSLINAYYSLHGKYPFGCSLYKHPRRAIVNLRNECMTDVCHGTRRWNIGRNSIVSMKKPTYRCDAILNLEQFILLFSFYNSGVVCAHYVFVKRIGETYRVHNYHGKFHDYNKEFFTLHFLKSNPKKYGMDYPLAWDIM